MEAAKDIVAALELAEQAAALSSVRIISDVAAGVQLLAAGAEAVLLNVDVNLPGIKDEEAAGGYARSRAEVSAAAAEKADAAKKVIAGRLS